MPQFIVSLVGGFNFYAEDLTRKVMGKTRHGSHPVVHLMGGEVAGEIVHYHENAHFFLNGATTVGKYLSALATVASRFPTGHSRLHEGVRKVMMLCTYTHEGYATAMQELRGRRTLTDTEASALRDLLPEAYRIARDWYRTVLDRLIPGFRSIQIPAEPYFFHEIEEVICHVLSIAAMSVPLSGVIADSKFLPAYPVLKQIERNAPDNRLQQLRDAWTSEFLEHCLSERTKALKSVQAIGTSRPIDDTLNRLAGELCRIAELGFENPDAIDIGTMCAKMGLPGIQEFDCRDIPIGKVAILNSISRAISPSLKHPIPVTWESAISLIHAALSGSGVVPDVLCEVLSRETASEQDADLVWLHLHLYCDKHALIDYHHQKPAAGDADERLFEQVQLTLACAPDNAAFLLRQLVTILPREVLRTEPETIPAGLPHRSFIWIIADVLLHGSKVGGGFDRLRFEECGRLVFPYFFNLNIATYTKLTAVPPKIELSAAPIRQVTPVVIARVTHEAESTVSERPPINLNTVPAQYEDGFNTELGLLYLQHVPHGDEYVLPVVFPHSSIDEIAQVGGISVEASSYLETSLCHTLVTGLYAEFLLQRSE